MNLMPHSLHRSPYRGPTKKRMGIKHADSAPSLPSIINSRDGSVHGQSPKQEVCSSDEDSKEIKIRVNKQRRNSSRRQYMSREIEHTREMSLLYYDFNNSCDLKGAAREPDTRKSGGLQDLKEEPPAAETEYVKEIRSTWE